MHHFIIFITFFMSQSVVKLAVLLSLHADLKVTLNSLGRVTCLPHCSPALGLPPISLWTATFCNISSADDGTVIRLLLGTQ
jgi:hypothetical protein